jgi:SAM-dependent methyltransferase
VVFRTYERMLAFGERGGEGPAEDGLPVPSAHLRVLVAGSPSRSDFLAGGRASREMIEQLFAEAGVELADCGALLDFGCGCGRILRHWQSLAGVEVFGCDYSSELVDWSRRNLPRATVTQNDLAPPAPYADGRFGAIYAISVFTHLTRDLHFAWMHDLVRMLRPDGRLLFTTHGIGVLAGLLPDERSRFDAGELVVRFDSEAGSNLCNAFQPEQWVREVLAKDLTVDVFRPGGTPSFGDQDVWIVRR